jgi:hypothetical protein
MALSKPSTVAPGKPVVRDLQDGYEFSAARPHAERQRRYLKNEIPFWNEMMKRNSRRLVESAQHPGSPEKY